MGHPSSPRFAAALLGAAVSCASVHATTTRHAANASAGPPGAAGTNLAGNVAGDRSVEPDTFFADSIVVAVPPGEPTYVVTGAHAANSTLGVEMLRVADDDSTAGGVVFHSAGSGGASTTDTWSPAYALPFPFKLYGITYHEFSVSKSGLLTFSTWAAGQQVNDAEPPPPPSELGVASSASHAASPPSRRALATGAPTTIATGGAHAAAGFGKLAPGDSNDRGESLPFNHLPPATIAWFYDPVLLPSTHTIRGFVYGSAPRRQVWIVNFGQRKRAQGETHTALVLEETSNRIMMVDMWAEVEPVDRATGNSLPGKTIVGVQRNGGQARLVDASPKVVVTGQSSAASDNAFYLFQPDTIGAQVKGDSHASLDAIDDFIAGIIESKSLPGITVAASLNGRLILSKGYGWADVEQQIPMRDWHRAQIGSVTKMLTATAVFRLIELDGLGADVALDMPLYGSAGVLNDLLFQQAIWNGITSAVENGTYSDETLWWNAYHNITIRNLLTHTSGFARSGDGAGTAESLGVGYADISYEDAHLHFLENQPLKSLPAQLEEGTSGGSLDFIDVPSVPTQVEGLAPPSVIPGPRRSYSNHGFGLMAHIITRASGVPYRSFMHEYVLGPIDLSSIDIAPVFWSDKTALDAKRYFHHSAALPYVTSYFDDSRVYGAYDYKPIIDNEGGTGSWVASARDLVRLICALDGLANQPDVLDGDSLAEMDSVPYPNVSGGVSQPHGWDAIGATGNFGKNGRMGFGTAQIYRYADGINVAVVANTYVGSNLSGTAQGVYSRVADAVSAGLIPFNYDLFESPGQIAIDP